MKPTLEQIEQAWRGLPIKATADGLPAPPQLSKTARRVNWAILALAGTLYVTGALCLALQVPSGLIFFGAVGLANLLVCVHALRSRRILGIAFRGRLIARREREPGLFWASLALFAIFGALLSLVLFTVAR
jgi:hypothetical protein